MDEKDEIQAIQSALRASDEEIAGRAGMSASTLKKAKKGMVPQATKRSFLSALETIRQERIELLSSLKIRAG